MSDFGTQIKFYGSTILQFSHVDSRAKLPTLAIEMTLSSNAWDVNNTIKMQLSSDELLKLCIYLQPAIASKDRVDELKIQRQQSDPKVLTIKPNKNDTFFIGLFDNAKDIKYSRVIGQQQILTLRLMAYGQLATIYKCSVSDLITMIGMHIKN